MEPKTVPPFAVIVRTDKEFAPGETGTIAVLHALKAN